MLVTHGVSWWWDSDHTLIVCLSLKDELNQKIETCSIYLLSLMAMESRVNFRSPLNISGASQWNSTAASS